MFCNVLHFAHPPHTEQDTERRCKVQTSEDVNDCAVVGAADPVKGQVPGSCVAGADVIRVLEMIESCTIGIIAGELVGCHMDNASSCVAGLQVYTSKIQQNYYIYRLIISCHMLLWRMGA